MRLNKKGDMTIEEFMGIFLAFVGIVLVGFLFYKLYGITVSSEEKQVRGVLDKIILNSNSLEKDKSMNLTIQGFKGAVEKNWIGNVGGWIFVGWNKDEKFRPDKCYFENCLCVCKLENPTVEIRNVWSDKNFLKSSCQDNGFCEEISFEIALESLVKNKGIYPDSGEYIFFPNSLKEIEIKKDANGKVVIYEDFRMFNLIQIRDGEHIK
jgi:hypothetical protein